MNELMRMITAVDYGRETEIPWIEPMSSFDIRDPRWVIRLDKAIKLYQEGLSVWKAACCCFIDAATLRYYLRKRNLLRTQQKHIQDYREHVPMYDW